MPKRTSGNLETIRAHYNMKKQLDLHKSKGVHFPGHCLCIPQVNRYLKFMQNRISQSNVPVGQYHVLQLNSTNDFLLNQTDQGTERSDVWSTTLFFGLDIPVAAVDISPMECIEGTMIMFLDCKRGGRQWFGRDLRMNLLRWRLQVVIAECCMFQITWHCFLQTSHSGV